MVIKYDIFFIDIVGNCGMVGDLLETSSKGKAHMVASHLNAIESVTSRKDGTKITYEVATIEI